MSFRIDRLATIHVVHPFMVAIGGRRRNGVPILMYHSISERKESGIHPYYQTTTSPSAFEEQIRLLRRRGFHSVPLKEIGHCFRNPAGAGRPIGITFDDGYKDFYTQAFPVLQKYGFGATVFLPTAYMGGQFLGKDCLSWTEVEELVRNGIEFGSHTVTHPLLHVLGDQDLRSELHASKQEIEDRTGTEISLFSYPYAFPQEDRAFTRRLSRILEECGYRWGVTTRIGRAGREQDRYFLKRIPVNDGDDLDLMGAKLAGAYDWVYFIQQAYRRVKKKQNAAMQANRFHTKESR
jgi:peptidoglycan/xylan/chitin deacetylase (PgdA/CDA1 family)